MVCRHGASHTTKFGVEMMQEGDGKVAAIRAKSECV